MRSAAASRAAGSASRPPAVSVPTIDLATRSDERVDHVPRLDAVAGHDRLRRRRVEAAGEHAEPVEDASGPSSSSSEYDQSTVARSVWWRSTAVRRPPVRSRKRSSSRRAISAGLIATTRAAASSIASGMPSSRRQISATASASRRLRAKPGRTACARSAKSRTASLATSSSAADPSAGSDSERSGQTCSPPTARPSRLVASDPHVRTAREDALGEPAGRVEQVLAVVEHEQQVLRAQELDDAALERRARPGLHARGSPPRPGPWRPDRPPRASSQSHAPSAKCGSSLGRDLDREPGLADAADAGERDEARRRRAPSPTRMQLVVATDERRQLHRQVARERVERSQGRESRRPARRRDLEDPLGPREVAQAVLAEVEQRHAVGEVVSDELLGHVRDHDLPTVRGRGHARRAVDRRSVVVAVAELGRAGVQAHPDPQRTLRPLEIDERALPGDGGTDGVAGRREHGVHAPTMAS